MSTADTGVNATPAAIELAQVNDVDLSEVEGTGTDGKVTVDDVRSHIEDSGDEVKPVDQATIDKLRGDTEGGVTEEQLEELDMEGPKPSELAPPATNLDVDIADVPEGRSGDELGPVILPGYWVKISPDAEVDEEFDHYRGSLATVVSGPWTPIPFANDGDETLHGYRFDEDTDYLVKTRGTAEATFELPSDASGFVDFGDGRGGMLGHA